MGLFFGKIEEATDVEHQVISIYNFGDMRNLSKTIVFEKVSLIQRKKS